MITNIKILFIVLVLSISSIGVMANSTGKFLKYSQVTDKEILIESTKGVKVLFTAYDDNSIGVTYFDKNSEVSLIAPSKILSNENLLGSIYVEEINELMNITTTSANGLFIKIDKRKFELTFNDKTNQGELVFENELVKGIVSNVQNICFTENKNENILLNPNPKL